MFENASATLIDQRRSDQGTEGLFVCSRFNCYSLELPWRDNHSNVFAMKDQAAQCWCDNATELTGKSWSYLKVNQSEYEKLKPENFRELILAVCEID
jgi:hypothetical protein